MRGVITIGSPSLLALLALLLLVGCDQSASSFGPVAQSGAGQNLEIVDTSGLEGFWSLSEVDGQVIDANDPASMFIPGLNADMNMVGCSGAAVAEVEVDSKGPYLALIPSRFVQAETGIIQTCHLHFDRNSNQVQVYLILDEGADFLASDEDQLIIEAANGSTYVFQR